MSLELNVIRTSNMLLALRSVRSAGVSFFCSREPQFIMTCFEGLCTFGGECFLYILHQSLQSSIRQVLVETIVQMSICLFPVGFTFR